MATVRLLELDEMRAKAGEAAEFLRALSNRPRLLVLCHLVEARELSVGQLVERVGISQSALSQHLAKLREQGLVAYRREAQTLFYCIADPRAERILETLHDLFCPSEEHDDR
ncbi:ArsR/SmtB family transcription factor [Erythrobacter ani]|uniref:Helix-turn-helix transcriptional regulator n=1 Tax=Erythrobacter ani TaxID=2827235 RepID=A0ABS6SKI6_9SPHN|nr:metalloregulator ArsR/SmtB family transcription factor [Erythrobacter ani]MBV7265482.1 helix-turn-helix transcriptional regulator [Erythrobacter ani]